MRIIRQLFILAMILTIGSLASPISAQTLYGAANGQPGGVALSNFFTIDPNTGIATLVGPIGFENVTGMACLPDGRLVASTNGDAVVPPGPAAVLIEINPATGAGTLIGTIGDLNVGECGRMPDITYDAATGELFGYGDFCANPIEGLHTVNPDTGAGTSIGPSGYFGGGNGLAAEPGTGTIYATPFDTFSLVIIDPMTGLGSDVPGSVGNVPDRVNALDFHPTTGELYGSWNDGPTATSRLVTINTADGIATEIGPTTQGLDAIAFQCSTAPPIVEVPTLGGSGLALLALLFVASAWIVLRRRRETL